MLSVWSVCVCMRVCVEQQDQPTAISFQLESHVKKQTLILTLSVQSRRVWITGSVVIKNTMIAWSLYAKADNRVHFADKRPSDCVVQTDLNPPHASVADSYPESVNGEYSIWCLL